MVIRIKKDNIVSFFLMILFLFISGNPIVNSGILIPEEIVVSSLFLFLALIFVLKKERIDKEFLWFLLLLGIISFIQYAQFNFFSLTTFLGLLFRILIAYMITKILGRRFVYFFVTTVYWLAIISIFFYFLFLLFPGLFSPVLLDVSHTEGSGTRFSLLGIHTFFPRFPERNSGPFWEPGAFAGYLVLGFLFTFFIHIKNRKRILIILSIAIFSTFSTTAYLAFFFFIAIILYRTPSNPLIRILIVPILIVFFFLSFTKLEFLGDKIINQYHFAKEHGLESENTQRFLSILRDQSDIQGYEFFGRGWSNLTRYDLNHDEQMRTVGLTDIIVKVGGVFFIIMLVFAHKSFRSFLKTYHYNDYFLVLGCLGVLFILLMSETYFNMSFFWALLFLQFSYTKGLSSPVFTEKPQG